MFAGLCSLSLVSAASADRNFSLRKQVNGPVDLVQVSNGWTRDNGTNIDVDSDLATVLSSSADLTLPAGATVRWAGLYWGVNYLVPATDEQKSMIQFRAPGDPGYTTVGPTGVVLDLGSSDDQASSFVDVTSKVAAAGSGTYTVGQTTNSTRGGWGMVVIYELPGTPPRGVSVYDGLRNIFLDSFSNPITGIFTPTAGPVRTKVGLLAYQADPGVTGDSITLNGTALGDSCSPTDDLFNGSHCRLGSNVTNRDPNASPNVGHDGDLFTADNVLPNGATSATVNITAVGDRVFPHALSFATDLHAPDLQTTKTVDNITDPGDPPAPGDVLEYTVSTENVGQDGASDVRVTDPVPAGTTFVPGSIAASPGVGSFDPASNRVILNLGQGATANSGGNLDPAGGGVTSATASFRVTVGAVSDGAPIRNTANISYTGAGSGIPLSGTARADVTARAPDLTLAKSHDPAFVAGGETTFRLVASNVGGVSSGGAVTVTDQFPGSFTSIQSASGDGWSCSIAGLMLTCSRTDALAPGMSFPPVTVDATVSDPAPATITNSATVSGGNDTNPANDTAYDSEGATEQAVLRVKKTGSPSSVLSGEEVEWEVEVTNAGPSEAQSVVLDDTILPLDYEDVRVTTTNGTCDDTVHCDLGDLQRGETARVRITAAVLANGTTLTNTATADSPTPTLDTSQESDNASVIVLDTADVSVTKTATPAPPPDPATVDPGNPVSFTITAGNSGPGSATGVTVTDRMPVNVQPTSVTAPGWDCGSLPGPGDLMTCTLAGPLAPAATPAIVVDATALDLPSNRIIDNTARIAADTGDPDLANNSDSTRQIITASADLTPSVTVSPSSAVGPTDPVTFMVTVSNLGPSLSESPQLTYQLPTGVSFDPGASSTSCSELVAGTVTCTLADIPSSGSAPPLTIVVMPSGITGQQLVDNTFTAEATTTPDQDETNNSAMAKFATEAAADLSITKSVDPVSAAPGQTVTYTIDAANNGPDGAGAVEVIDQLPGGLSFGAFTQNPGGACSESSGAIDCQLGALPATGTVQISYTATPQRSAAGQVLLNGAEVSSATPDLDQTDNRAAVELAVTPIADVAVESDATPDPAAASDLLSFIARVTNNGVNSADGVTLTETLPAGVSIVSMPAGCSLVGLVATCDLGPLGPGATRELVFRATADNAAAGTTVSHSSHVDSGPQGDDVLGNNDDSASLTIERLVSLSIEKAVSPSMPQAGGTVTYTLTVRNAGVNQADATVVDSMPPGVTATAMSPSQGTCDLATVSCHLGAIGAGGQAQVQITGQIAPTVSGPITNRAMVMDTGATERKPSDNAATVAHPVGPAAAPAPPTVDRARKCFGRPATILVKPGAGPVHGTPGIDVIVGSRASDRIHGVSGQDFICGRLGPDTITGGAGNDRIRGGRGRDRLHGKSGHDILYGNKGADRLFSNHGRDRIHGGRGPDRLFGGVGRDRLIGGPGRNRIAQ